MFGIAPPIAFKGWQPASYADYDGVLTEAVADVNRDVAAALRKIGVDEISGRAGDYGESRRHCTQPGMTEPADDVLGRDLS